VQRGGKRKETAEKENRGDPGWRNGESIRKHRGREKDLKIHRKQKTERGKNRGRTEEERASTYQLHHLLRPQATASPPAAPGNRKKKQRGAGKKKEENRRGTRQRRKKNRGRRGNTGGGRKKEREGDGRREVKNKRQT
jgi:hypothetical protein